MSLAHAIVVINQLRFISLFITRGWHSFEGSRNYNRVKDNRPGDTGLLTVLFDTPIVDTFNELIVLAHDTELHVWKGLVESIYRRKPKKGRRDRRSELISTL